MTVHRGAVKALLPGRKPCLCGGRISTDDWIVKRWGGWIHLSCYDELTRAKQFTKEEK